MMLNIFLIGQYSFLSIFISFEEMFVHPFLIGLFIFYYCVTCSLYIIWIQIFIRHVICKYFSSLMACISIFLTVSFKVQKLLILTKSNLSILSLRGYTFGVISKKLLVNPISQRFSLRVSSRSFTGFTNRSMIHLSC